VNIRLFCQNHHMQLRRRNAPKVRLYHAWTTEYSWMYIYQSILEYSIICGCTKTSPSYVLRFKPRQLEWLALSNQDLVCTSILLVWQWLVFVCSIHFPGCVLMFSFTQVHWHDQGTWGKKLKLKGLMKAHPRELSWEHHHQLYYACRQCFILGNTVGSGGSSAEAVWTKIYGEVEGHTLSTDCMYWTGHGKHMAWAFLNSLRGGRNGILVGYHRICLHTDDQVCLILQNPLIQPAIALYGDFAISEELQQGLAEIIARETDVLVMVCMCVHRYLSSVVSQKSAYVQCTVHLHQGSGRSFEIHPWKSAHICGLIMNLCIIS